MYDKKLFDGFFNFARCVLKNGKYSPPTSVAHVVSKGIDVKLALDRAKEASTKERSLIR